MRESGETGHHIGISALAASVHPRWQIRQGEDMGRPSRLLGRTMRESDEVASVHVGGGAVVMMEGALHV